MRAALPAVYRAAAIPERNDSMALSVSAEVARQRPALVNAIIGQTQHVVMIKLLTFMKERIQPNTVATLAPCSANCPAPE
jgi:hypothetical protein